MEKNLRPFVAELVGTFAFVFAAAGAVCMSHLYAGLGQPQAYFVGIALAQGCMLTAALAATVNVSGGFLNPAITLTLWVFKRLDGDRACWLVAAQFLGGFVAGLVLRFMFAADVLVPARFGTPHLQLDAFRSATFMQALISGVGIEFLLTFLLTFVIYGALLDPRAPQLGILGPGLALTALVLLGYPLTGTAANPARWLGPALWELTLRKEDFGDHAVYWIGPIFGALAAGLLYEYVILSAGQTKAVEASSEPGLVTSTLYKSKK